MMRVILESPYAGQSKWWCVRLWQQWRNRRYARAAVRDSLMRGESPIASHLLYTQRGILRDHVPAERKLGIEAGLAWKSAAHASVVYTDFGTSSGMQYGIKSAKEAGLLVEYRSIGWKR